jgi:hypothetical protein
MALSFPDPEDVIYKTTESEKLLLKPKYWMLKSFLRARHIYTELYTPDEWLDKYEQAKAYLQEIDDDVDQARRLQGKPGRSAEEKVLQWSKKVDMSSKKSEYESDSAYYSEN